MPIPDRVKNSAAGQPKPPIPIIKTLDSWICFCPNYPIFLKPQSSCLVPTGISVAFSEAFEIQIRPRSGLAAKNNISVLNTPGTIDSDYRGEIKVIIFNHGNKEFIINNNDRIAQMILTPVVKMELEEIESLPETIRGEGGFGSTGKWAKN